MYFSQTKDWYLDWKRYQKTTRLRRRYREELAEKNQIKPLKLIRHRNEKRRPSKPK